MPAWATTGMFRLTTATVAYVSIWTGTRSSDLMFENKLEHGQRQPVIGEVVPPAETWGLLATGSAGRWSIDVDECRAENEWVLDLDGPNFYLNIGDGATLASSPEHSIFSKPDRNRPPIPDALPLGRFGSAPVDHSGIMSQSFSGVS